MLTSEKTDKVLPALLKALSNIGAATKDSDNPFFKSKYCDLNKIYETVRQPLLDQGIILLQPTVAKESVCTGEFRDYVVTQLVHAESGQYVSSEFPIVAKDTSDPQKLGAAQTYARRFGLQALIGLSTEDDDGNSASGKESPKTSYKKAAPKTTTKVTTEKKVEANEEPVAEKEVPAQKFRYNGAAKEKKKHAI